MSLHRTRAPGPWLEAAAVLACLALGALLRFYQLPSLPPGLYTDEAYYALDAVDILNGARPIYLPANNGREPLFAYLLAPSLAILGRTPLAIRVPAALLGTLDILAAYLLGRALFGRRVAVMMAALTAGTLWAVALSRIGLRAATLPPLAALMLAGAAYGFKTRRRWLIALAGGLCGLCFYTYLSGRLIPAPLIGFGVFWYSARRLRGERPGGSAVVASRDLAAFFLSAALVASPLAVYAIHEPQTYLGRVEQVSIFSGGMGEGWAALLNNVGAVLGMFIWRGDLNPRHNLPGRPVFDPVLGAAFFLGIGLALARAGKRGDGAAALALLWTGAMLAPTVLSRDAPHFLRAIGALPMVFAFPALSLDAAWRWAEQQPGAWLRLGVPGLIVALLGAHAAQSAYHYFGPYARDPATALAFQAATVDLAEESNAYLAAGERRLFLDRRLWDGFPAVRFLLRDGPGVQVTSDGDEPGSPATSAARAVVWPHVAEPWAALRFLPADALITAEAGSLYRNDPEPEPYPLYATYTAGPKPAASAPVAEFGGFGPGIVLRGADVVVSGDRVRVVLSWSAAAAVTDEVHVFVHLRDHGQVVSQADGPLGGSLYPARAWRAGDWVAQSAEVAWPEGEFGALELVAGLYRYPSGERLTVTGTGADAVPLPLPTR
jgi:4-amino-4-deoxy-L-arabinose transferase-like glycosyltransferase